MVTSLAVRAWTLDDAFPLFNGLACEIPKQQAGPYAACESSACCMDGWVTTFGWRLAEVPVRLDPAAAQERRVPVFPRYFSGLAGEIPFF
jgi:hypothetical protein